MKKKLSLAYSPCPNDTYIFYAMAHGRTVCENSEFDITLADVETLNQKAKSGGHDISKLSFSAFGHLRDRYGLLRSGAALGSGCGPLIVAKPGTGLRRISSEKIAVPGLWTTACLLLGLFMSEKPDVVPVPFDQIMPAVSSGKYLYGVIIHEGRFTYSQYGLDCLTDLGEWWENRTSLPIPLGGICARRDISSDTAASVEAGIRESIRYAKRHPEETEKYICRHARETEISVIRSHIELYVNDFTMNLGDKGVTAVETLFDMAETADIMPKNDRPLFAC